MYVGCYAQYFSIFSEFTCYLLYENFIQCYRLALNARYKYEPLSLTSLTRKEGILSSNEIHRVFHELLMIANDRSCILIFAR